MSFLAPLFLIGAVAVAAPIIFHLIRRTSREKVPFSSLMFLQPTPPRVTRSSRVENLLLLLLRCLILCLLALGFARPFLQKPVAADDAAGEGRRIAVVIDASASMRRDNLWADAKDRARQVLRRTTPADTVGLFLLDRTARPLMSFEQWTATAAGDRTALALQRLQAAEPSWAGTHFGQGLLTVTEELEESAGKNQRTSSAGARRLVVITDLQEGMHLDGLQGFEWPRGLEVVLETLKAKRPSNAGLQLLLEKDDAQERKPDVEIRVRVSNSSDAKREQFRLGWAARGEKGFTGTPLDVYVPPGQSRVLSVARPATGGDLEQLLLTGDDEEFDNRIFVVTPKPEQIRVLFLGPDGEKDPAQLLYYLRRAFPETRRQTVQIVNPPANGSVAAEDLYAAPLLVATDGLAGERLKAARAFLEMGKPLLFVLKGVAGATSLAELTGRGTLQAEEATGANYALLGQVAFDHPLFAPFADPRFSDFSKIHFWKHRRLRADDFPGAKVLARFDQGDPALLQVPVAKGLVFVLTSGWHPADSQLALSSKFVPLLYSLLDLSGGVKAQFAQYLVGDPITLPATNAAQTFSVRKPDGKEVKVKGDDRFGDTDQPGVYTVGTGGAAASTAAAGNGPGPLRFAVNQDPSESRTAPLALEELERLRLPLKVSSPELAKREEAKRVRLQAVELEQRQKLWRWLIVAALGVLILETWLAGWLTRRQAQAQTT